MMLLAIDTSASLCAASVYDAAADRELARSVEDIGKGHAERLMAVVDDALNNAGKTYRDIDRIAVAIGPGSFTGIRVGVATARGLALALKVPAIGINNLEAVAFEARTKHQQRNILSAFASSLGAIQLAIYDPSGEVIHAPETTTAEHAAQFAIAHQAVVIGSAAPVISALNPAIETGEANVTADIAIYARLASSRPASDKPKPLYLREPDAKPQAGFRVSRAAS